MDPFNNWMNRVDGWTRDSNSIFKSEIASRALTVPVSVPLELAAAAENIIRAPFEAVLLIGKGAVKAARVVSSSEYLEKLENRLPTVSDFLKTIARVAAYIVGAFVTLTVGVVKPALNFDLHSRVPYLNLVTRNVQAAVQKEEPAPVEEEDRSESSDAELLSAIATLLDTHQAAEAQVEARSSEEPAAENDRTDGPVFFAGGQQEEGVDSEASEFSEGFRDLYEGQEAGNQSNGWFSWFSSRQPATGVEG